MKRASWLLLALVSLAAEARADRTGARRAAYLGSKLPAAERGDAARTARFQALPARPIEARRVSLGATPVGGAVATGAGLAVGAGRALCLLEPRSGDVTRVELGGPPAHAPAVDAAGRVWLLTARAELLVTESNGTILTRRPLPVRGAKLRAAPVLSRGALVVAAGNELLEVDVDGAVRAEVTLPDTPSIALASDGARVFAATDLGRVFTWDGARAPVELPRVGGLPTSSMTITSAGPALVVDAARVVRLDRHAPTWVTWVRADSGMLEGPLATTALGEVFVETTSGLLLGASPDGKETRRVSLPSPRAAHAEAIGGVGPGPILDESGRLAFVRGSGELGVLEGDTLTMADRPACAEPVGLTASSAGLFVTCADGVVVAYR